MKQVKVRQEAAVAPLVKVFRRLPAEPFEAVENTSGSQEVVVRSLTRSDRTIFYAVNPTPWPLTVNIELRGPQPLKMLPYLEERAGRAEPSADGLAWTVELQPFDLVGGEVAGTAKVVLAGVKPPADAGDALREQIGDILKRAHFLADRPRHIALPNAGFEEAAEGNGVLHWLHARETGMVVERELASGVDSGSALHLVSRGTAPLWVRSSPLPVPSTGRLKMTAKVRIADAARQPQLRMAVEGRLDGQVYYQRVNYGAPERQQDEAPGALSTEWTECIIACLKLPVQGLSDLRVGFDLMGPGEVWIDEVEVTDLWLQEGEYKELLKSVPTAKRKLEEGRLNECRLLTGGYWPSFLRRHVNLSSGPGTAPLAPPEGTASAPRAPRGKANLLPPSIPMPQLPARPTRSADRNRTWWPSWMKWK